MAEQKRESIVRWAQVGATVFLGVVGLVFTYVTNLQQEENRNNQIVQQEKNRINQLGIQIMSQREQSEIDFRQKMFGVLVTELLDPKVDVRERVTRLILFQHNFHDIFNGRALFDVLENEARNLPEEGRDSVIKQLVSLAKKVTVAQELLVGSKPNIFTKKEGERFSFTVPSQESEQGNHEHGENNKRGDDQPHDIIIKLIKVKEHAVEIEVIIDAEKPDSMKLEFEVSFFDAPLTDNTLLPDKHRFAITLKETNMSVQPYEATLSVFEFPADYVTTGYRPSIKEANKMFKNIQ